MGCKAIWRIVRTSEKILATPLDKKKYPVEPRVTEVLSGMAQVGQPPWPKVLCGRVHVFRLPCRHIGKREDPGGKDEEETNMAGAKGVCPSFFNLPWEDVIFLHIFPHFSIQQLFKCRRVSRFFREVCDSYFAWQRSLDCSEVSSRLTTNAFSLLTKASSSLQLVVLKNCKGWLDEASLVEVLKRNPRISELDLTACSSLTNLSLYTLAEFNSGLRVIKLRECRWVSSDAVIQLSLCCNGLQHVDLTGCWEVTDSCVSSLASCCNGLQTLLLNDCYSVSDNSVRIVANSCPKLSHLGLKGCWRVSNTAIKLIGEYCPYLDTLKVRDCRDISEASLARLRLRGVKIDVGKTKRLRLHAGLYGYVEHDDWQIPVVNLNI